MLKLLLLLGGLGLLFVGAYSLPEEGIPYSRQHTARLGPFEATARTRERIGIPAPLGWMLVLAGSGLALAGGYVKRK
jgi:hypothetical protein